MRMTGLCSRSSATRYLVHLGCDGGSEEMDTLFVFAGGKKLSGAPLEIAALMLLYGSATVAIPFPGSRESDADQCVCVGGGAVVADCSRRNRGSGTN